MRSSRRRDIFAKSSALIVRREKAWEGLVFREVGGYGLERREETFCEVLEEGMIEGVLVVSIDVVKEVGKKGWRSSLVLILVRHVVDFFQHVIDNGQQFVSR